jgi:RNA polymerase sporulation-specific sigma factor
MYCNNGKYIQLAQNNNEEAMEMLIKNNSGLIWNIVRRFTGRGYETEDLYQIGCIGLIKAIKRFDINLDVQLSTYAVPYIMGEIKRFIRDDGIIKISRQTKELSVKIKQIQNDYMNKLGEEIPINLIADKLNISKEEVAAAIESTQNVNSIYNIEAPDGSDDRMLIDKISDNKDEYNKLVDEMTLKDIINNLEQKEKEVILLRFYKEQTQSQVGKILGITQVQVSRIEKRVLEKMKLKLEAV